ncbi:hypothetical protein [Alkalibacillus salilacus]|uniref:DNA-binding transcriptional regulator YafY n=1 Tax=Alkalibacillus salilacus TaxID=284582 RepID=A0ABT9VDC8_9BACI|nr:hypothetical protein [Alkalibacillus salilacus]MDQ0158941.1 putative DNA-binding transcriptional regulator YafY [Alkalibacillus salilacus]
MGQLLPSSLRYNKKLEMVYIDHHNNMTQRTVTIIKMEDHRILAYCFTRQAVRSFQKANILAIYPIDHNQSKQMEA